MIWAALVAFAIAVTPLAKIWGLSGNWRASFLFGASIVLVRIVFHFEIAQPILAMAVIYSGMAVLGVFYTDWIAGVFLAFISLIIASEIEGLLPQQPRQILGELAFVVGLVSCSIAGPSGGLFSPHGSKRRNGGRAGPVDRVASS